MKRPAWWGHITSPAANIQLTVTCLTQTSICNSRTRNPPYITSTIDFHNRTGSHTHTQSAAIYS